MNQENEIGDDVLEFAEKLFDAARTGQTEFVISAITQGVPINLSESKGNTLLMLAAYNGQTQLTKALAQNGADVNKQNDRGQTPLAGAVFKKDQEIIKILLQHGADKEAGTPSATETAQMFNTNDLLS